VDLGRLDEVLSLRGTGEQASGGGEAESQDQELPSSSSLASVDRPLEGGVREEELTLDTVQSSSEKPQLDSDEEETQQSDPEEPLRQPPVPSSHHHDDEEEELDFEDDQELHEKDDDIIELHCQSPESQSELAPSPTPPPSEPEEGELDEFDRVRRREELDELLGSGNEITLGEEDEEDVEPNEVTKNDDEPPTPEHAPPSLTDPPATSKPTESESIHSNSPESTPRVVDFDEMEVEGAKIINFEITLVYCITNLKVFY